MQIGVTTLLGTAVASAIGMGATVSNQYFTRENPKSLLSALVADRNVAVERNISFGTHPRHKLDIYRPRSGKGSAVILFLYGGGWHSGERSTYGFAGAALASRGFTVVVSDYRLYPEVDFPSFVDDAAKAYAYTARNVSSGRPVFVMGHSAGAHMAAMISLDEKYLKAEGKNLPKPAGLIGLAGPYSFDPTTWPTTKHMFTKVKTNADVARPVTFVSKNAPPALLMHGLDDTVVKLWNLDAMSEAYKKAGVPVRQKRLKGFGHVGIVLAMARPFRWRYSIVDEVVDFIRAQKDQSTFQ